MAGMKRFVTYIYVYEEKKKGNNVGFAKIEIRGEDCRIEIHLRGLYTKKSLCTVYLFRENAGEIEGIRMGEMCLANGNGDFGVIVRSKNIGESDMDIDAMEGIFLLAENNEIFMSRWKEGNPLVVCRENFREWKPVVDIEAAEEKKNEDIQVSHDVIHATELPLKNLFPDYTWEEVWKSLKENHPVYRPFVDKEVECVQIELKNLRELPKRYWYLGNNSFLLHGFFNYQYLVVGRNGEDRWFIGVPGIYQRQERVMAAIFGFAEFIALARATGLEKKDDMGNGEPINQFGCWCRYIEE